MKIYTKTGDKGLTGLIGGTRVLKSSLRIECYGTVDELNSWLGLCRDGIGDEHIMLMIKEIQDRLFTIGSSLACDPNKAPKYKMPDLLISDVTLLEHEMDSMNEVLEPMKYFILPGGHSTISHLHLARCVCRRAERLCVQLQEIEEYIDPLVIQYINRLSDYLFVVARYMHHTLAVNEIPWKPRIVN